MRYPEPLIKGETIGICATSSGVTGLFSERLTHALDNIRALGYHVVSTDSVHQNEKLISANAEIRAMEFMDLYLNDDVKVIIPPWGGELLMEILPLLDFDLLNEATPKWVVGFSDTSALLLSLTLKCHMGTVHGPNALDFAPMKVDPNVLALMTILNQKAFTQNSCDLYQGDWGDVSKDIQIGYQLTEPVKWQSLSGEDESFEGRLLGGCTDIICKLVGTPFADVKSFTKEYQEGFIWYFESCCMNATDLYRTFWQMNLNGWFDDCKGILIGRAEGYEDSGDFNYNDVLTRSFSNLNIPVIYDIDIGHIPPQLILINGAMAKVDYTSNKGSITQKLR